MATTPLSGRYGRVEGIYSVGQWQINDNGTLARFVNSGTRIGHGSRPGITSWSGSYMAHGGIPAVLPGVEFGFAGYTAPDNGIRGTSGMVYSGNAFCNSIQIAWDWQSGNVLEHQVGFDGHLGLVPAEGYPDNYLVDISNPEPIGPCFISYSVDGITWTVLNNLSQANLQMSNAIQPYVNSSTNSMTGRTPGIFDATASITIQDTVEGSGLVKGSPYQFRFYNTATTFYLLQWMRVKEFTGLQVATQTGAIIQHQVALEHSGVEVVSSIPTAGTILEPGGTQIWGG